MKFMATLLMLLALFLPYAYPQEYPRLSLPEGAVARLGKGWLNAVRYFPDGTRLAAATSSGIWVYDAATYRAVDLFTGHQGKVYCLSFSPDGRILASGGADHTIHLWDIATGEIEGPLTGHTGEVTSLSFSPDGKTLASVGREDRDGTMRLWDVQTGELKRTLTGHRYMVYCVAFSPDGKTLASGHERDGIHLWDAETGKLKRVLTGHRSGVFAVSVQSGWHDTRQREWRFDIRWRQYCAAVGCCDRRA